MSHTVVAGLYFVLACSSDILAVEWQEARERRRPLLAANVGIAIGALAWAPLVVFVATLNWQIIVADLLGGWLGSYLAVRRLQAATAERAKTGCELSP